METMYKCHFCGMVLTSLRYLQSHQSNNALCNRIQAAGGGLQQHLEDSRHVAFRNARRRRTAERSNEGIDEDRGDERVEENDEDGGQDMDVDEEDGDFIEEDPIPDEVRITRLFIYALRTCGPHGTALTDRGVDAILKIVTDPAYNPELMTVKSAAEMNAFLDNQWVTRDGAYMRLFAKMREARDPEEWGELKLWAADPLQAIMDMVRSSEAGSLLTWEAANNGSLSSAMTGARAIRRQARIRAIHGPSVFYLPIIVYSDKTHLDEQGHHKGHPVLVKLAGWKESFWYDRRASRLVMLMPETPTPAEIADEEGQNRTVTREHIKRRKYEIYHHSIDLVFDKLKRASKGYVTQSFRRIYIV
jgi:Plavaka transposase